MKETALRNEIVYYEVSPIEVNRITLMYALPSDHNGKKCYMSNSEIFPVIVLDCQSTS